MRVNRVILIGFRASGKTSVGKKLARELGFRFIDLDDEIEKSLNKSIRELVEENGWEEFRKIEKEFLRKFGEEERVVLALGGGAVLHQREMEELKKRGTVIWLYADPEKVIERIKKDSKSFSQRPSLTGKS